ncbi:MAG: spermidine synthase, partial [Candidatus Rokuibacteriota bacterium]
LLIALGGALGGLFAGVVAPLAFVQLVELPAGLLLTGLLWVLVSLETLWPRLGRYPRIAAVALLPFALGIYVTYVLEGARVATRGYGTMLRSFYGQLAVRHDGAPEDEDASRTLVHGGIIHGTQWLADARRRQTTTYYCETSGVGHALALLPASRPRRVGLVGLGVGTLAAYGRRGDVYRAYDINPQVVRLAQTEFTFLRDSAATVEIVLGDARIRMEAETPQELDLLAVDAFSGDAVPAHLLTHEALAVYVRHLAPTGILALHVSNRFVDLEPVVAGGALALGRPAVTVIGEGDGERLCYYSQWILIPPRDGQRRYPELWQLGTRLEPTPGFRPWTDEIWSLYPVLRKGGRH